MFRVQHKKEELTGLPPVSPMKIVCLRFEKVNLSGELLVYARNSVRSASLRVSRHR
jgi:hypothetical protein